MPDSHDIPETVLSIGDFAPDRYNECDMYQITDFSHPGLTYAGGGPNPPLLEPLAESEFSSHIRVTVRELRGGQDLDDEEELEMQSFAKSAVKDATTIALYRAWTDNVGCHHRTYQVSTGH